MIMKYKGISPNLGKNVFLAPGVHVIGSVEIGEYASVWFNCVLRGDIDSITVGRRTNIQDLTVIHPNQGQPVIIEDDVTIGHSCILHGCKIGKGSLIGMGAVILNDAVIGENCLVAARSLITERKVFPANSFIMGSPAKVIRELTSKELALMKYSAQSYLEKGQEYLEENNK